MSSKPDQPRLNSEDTAAAIDVPKRFDPAAPWGKELRKAQELARARRGAVTNADTGKVIRIARRGIDSATADTRSVRDLDVVQKLHELLEGAKYAERTPPDVPEPGVVAYHTFYAPIRYDGALHRVQLTVKEHEDGHWFHDQHSFKMENPDARSEAAGDESLPGSRLTQATGATVKLGGLLRGVKYRDGTPIFLDQTPRAAQGWTAAEGGSDLIPILRKAGAVEMPEEGVHLLFQPEYAARRAEVAATLKRELEARGLGRIGIRVADMIATNAGKFANGYYFRKLITVALNSSDELSGLLDHELIHALRDMDLFSKGEWRILEAEARRKWLNDPDIAKRVSGYDRLTGAQKVEEAIAFAAQRGPAARASTFAARMFNRVRDFFRALGNAFRGNGFATPESIFRDIREGGFGKRLNGAEGAPSDTAHYAFGTREEAERVAREDSKSFGTPYTVVQRYDREHGTYYAVQQASANRQVRPFAEEPADWERQQQRAKSANRPTQEPGAGDASGKPLPQLVIPGAERSAKQAAASRETATGRIAPKAPQKPAGGLFAEPDQQADLFGGKGPRFALSGGPPGGGELPLAGGSGRPLGERLTEWEDALHRIRTNNAADAIDSARYLGRAQSEISDPELRKRFYQHSEEGTPLAANEQALYDKWVQPVRNASLALYRRLSAAGYPVDNAGYVHRIARDKGAMYDETPGSPTSPIYGNRSLGRKTPSMNERTAPVMAVGDKGTQTLVPRGAFNIGDRYADPRTGENFTVREATTREIEAGTNIRYYQDGLLNEMDNYLRLSRAARNAEFLDTLKRDPDFKANAVEPGKGSAPLSWKQTDLPQLSGWRMNPRIAHMIDDFVGRPGALDSTLGRINHALVSAMFLSPAAAVGHGLNVAAATLKARGWDNFLPHTWARSFGNVQRAMRDVSNLSPDYLRMLRQGASLQYAGAINSDFHRLLVASMEGELRKNPLAWSTIAKAAGTSVPELYRSLAALSTRGLWHANDVMLLSRIYDLQAKGLSAKDAIATAEQHIPNYRVPTEAWDGEGGRAFSAVMKNPNLLIFSRYRYGLIKSYANDVKDMTRGTPQQRMEAAGRLLTVGVMVGLLYPMADAAIQYATGNKNAELRRSGPASVANNIWQALRGGEKDWGDAISGIASLAPGTNSALELWQNRQQFTGQRVYNPRGKPGEIAGELGLYALKQISPAATALELAQGRKGAGEEAASALGVRLPTNAEVAARKRAQRRDSRAEQRSFGRQVTRLKRGVESLLP